MAHLSAPDSGPLSPLARYCRDAAGRAFAQAPVLAVLAGLSGAIHFAVFLFLMDPGPSTIWARFMLALFLFFLGLFHFSLLMGCNLALEALYPWRRGVAPLDLLKALVLAPTLVLLVLSALKFTRTKVHLRGSDLWFFTQNARQIVREGTATEGALWAGAAVAVLAAILLVWVLLMRSRRNSGPRPRLRTFLLLALSGIVGLALVPPGPAFLRRPLAALVQAPALIFQSYAGYANARIAPRLKRLPPEEAAGPPIAPYAPELIRDRLNLVLVMLEAVPWNAAGYNGGPAGATPRLDALARESVVFTRPYAVSSQSHYSQMAILSSLFPHKFQGHDYYTDLAYPRALIWDALRPAGYATAMFSCQNEEWGNMIRYLRTPGLEVFRHCRDWPHAPHRENDPATKVWEETVVGGWGEWLGGLSRRPFFTYLNFQATHFPYEVPPGAPEPFTPCAIDFPCTYAGYPASKVPVMRNRFHNALHYSDGWLGAVIDRLQAAGEWDRTVLAVISDHGEAFLDHGQVAHGTNLHEEQIRSVLLVRAPGLAPRRVEEPVSHLDLAPALLHLLWLPPHRNFQGRRDILDPAYRAAGRPVFFTLQGMVAWDGMLLDGWKIMLHWDLAEEHLYDLTADPGERDDRSAGSLRLEAMNDRLRGFLAAQETYYEGRLWDRGVYPPPAP